MLLGARQFFERRGAPTPPLPYDAEVEYIESTGTQWIDTGVPMDYAHVTFGGTISTSAVGTGGFALGFALSAIPSYVRAFSIETSANARAWFQVISGSSVYGDFGSGLVPTSCSVDFSPSPHIATIGGIEGTFTATDWEPSNIFAFGNGTAFGSVRIHALWIKTDGVLVRDMIPVRKNGVGYMYDVANPTGGAAGDGFYANAGTGAFTIGPDKS